MKHFGLMLLLLMFPMCIWAQSSNVITENTSEAVVSFSNGGAYEWIWDNSKQVLKSSNYNISSSVSTTTITFDMTYGGKISFNYGVSSEDNYDKFSVMLDGVTIVNNISGVYSSLYEKEGLSQGVHTLSLSYSKDGSVDNNGDYAYISNLKFTSTAGIYHNTVKWVVSDNTLYFYGVGDGRMYYDRYEYPWSSYKDVVSKVVVDKNIKSLTYSALNNFKIISMEIEDSEETISISPYMGYYSTVFSDLYMGRNIEKNTEGTDNDDDREVYLSVESLHVGPNVTDIFSHVSVGKTISIDENNPYFMSDDEVVYNKNRSELVKVLQVKKGDFEIPNTVHTIRTKAFYMCNIESIKIPNSVQKIQDHAFEYSLYLADITIPSSVVEIGFSAFEDCTSLTSITVPENVISIGYSAFRGCTRLQTANIDNSIVSPYQFFECENLKNVNFSNDKLTIGFNAFSFRSNYSYGEDIYDIIPCTYNFTRTNWFSLEHERDIYQRYVGNDDGYSAEPLYSFLSKRKITIEGSTYDNKEIVIPDGIETVSEGKLPSGISSVVFPSSMKNIGSNICKGFTGLKTVTISSGVISIGADAFGGCTGLSSISIPSSVSFIGENAFSGCTSLPVFDNIRYADTYLIEAIDKKVISYNIKEGTRFIGSNAFNGCSHLTNIVIPSSIIRIGDSAFNGCTGLSGSLTIPSCVTFIGNDAFTGCSGINEVKIEDGATELSLGYKSNSSSSSSYYGLFKDCPIDTLYLGRDLNYSTHSSSYSYPGFGAPFEKQSKLKNVTIGENVTRIGAYAFCDCRGLTGITIPEGVTSIGICAFRGSSLTGRLTMPSSVTNIGSSAFSGCNNIKALLCKSTTPPLLGSSAFSLNKKQIIVPAKSVDAYKSAWSYLYDNYFLPMAEVMLVDEQSAKNYNAEVEGMDKSAITSVGLYSADNDGTLTEEVLKAGMNPNCLYFVPANSTLVGNNIVDFENRIAEKIVLQDNYAYNNPIPFTTGEIEYVHNPSVWADGKKGWETLVLPFSPNSIEASESGYISPIMLGSNGNFWLRQYVGCSNEAVYFASTPDGVIKANTPYIVAFPGDKFGRNSLEGQAITFKAGNVDVPITEAPSIQKNGYTMVGNYDATEDEGSGWVLNEDGSCFVSRSSVGDKPFSAYFRGVVSANESSMLRMDFGDFENSTGIEQLQYADDMDDATRVYTLDGRCIKSETLKSGLYVVNQKKIMVR